MFDDAVTTVLDAAGLVAVAAGVALLVAGITRPGLGLAAGGAVLLVLLQLAAWVSARSAPAGGSDGA